MSTSMPPPAGGAAARPTDRVALSLYSSAYCLYCRVVTREIERLGVDVEVRDIRMEPRFRAELAAARGRTTVPVLRIDMADGTTTWMPESRDIVAYLRALRRAVNPART